MPLSVSTVFLQYSCSCNSGTFTLSAAWARSLSDMPHSTEWSTSRTSELVSENKKLFTTRSVVSSLTLVSQIVFVSSSTASRLTTMRRNWLLRRGLRLSGVLVVVLNVREGRSSQHWAVKYGSQLSMFGIYITFPVVSRRWSRKINIYPISGRVRVGIQR